MAVAALILSIVAILVAGWAGWYTRMQGIHTKRQAELLTAQEDRALRAQLRTELRAHAGWHQVFISNYGQHPAEDVIVYEIRAAAMDEDGTARRERITEGLLGRDQPNLVEPGSTKMSRTGPAPRSWPLAGEWKITWLEVELGWRDGAGDHHVKDMELYEPEARSPLDVWVDDYG